MRAEVIQLPLLFLVFSGEIEQWTSMMGEILNELAVEVSKSKKGLYFPSVQWLWPVSHSRYFYQVHFYVVSEMIRPKYSIQVFSNSHFLGQRYSWAGLPSTWWVDGVWPGLLWKSGCHLDRISVKKSRQLSNFFVISSRTGKPETRAAQTHPERDTRWWTRRCGKQGSKSPEVHFHKIYSLFRMVRSGRGTPLPREDLCPTSFWHPPEDCSS